MRNILFSQVAPPLALQGPKIGGGGERLDVLLSPLQIYVL